MDPTTASPEDVAAALRAGHLDDRRDWAVVFRAWCKALPALGLKERIARVKRARYERRVDLARFRWDKEYEADLPALREAFRARSSGCGSIDNLRVARLGCRRATRAYFRQKKDGCCGAVDVVVSVNGSTYRIGFNYGH